MNSDYLRLGPTASTIAVLQMVAPPVISILTLMLCTKLYEIDVSDHYTFLAVISALLYYMVMRRQVAEDWTAFTASWSVVRRTAMSWLAVLAILAFLGYATKVSDEYSRRVLFTWFAITPPCTAAVLVLLRKAFRQTVISAGRAQVAVIAGVNEASLRLGRSIMERQNLGLTLKGYFDDRDPKRLGDLDRRMLLGKFADLREYARRERIDTIFVAIPVSYAQRARALLDDLTDTTASLYFVPDLLSFDLMRSMTTDVDGIPVVALCETPFHGLRGLCKRASDVFLASIMLLLALPFMAIIAAAVKLTTPGSVIFRQRRYGLDGQEIVVYKFRTMTTSDDGASVRQASRDDDRTTPVGRFLRRYSLDELPQLINVLQGSMSVVGPRPHAVAHNEEYRKLIRGYMVRHKVAPGITGLAQINGCRGQTANVDEMRKRLAYDLEYLGRWSLLLDFKILLRTMTIWFRDEKAY
jgi:putative colanic acid biosysnthesis UDP-glucose lipid carrier transferase